jgi:exodeoxyribonuclease-5
MTSTATTQPVTLTSEQEAIANSVLSNYASGQTQMSIGGLAGTGKTVLARFLRTQLGSTACVVAPTGKAAEVLRQKGIPAETIHSVIYRFVGMVQEKDESGKPTEHGTPVFDSKMEGEVEIPSVFICDESSMVNKEVYNDLVSQGVPIIWIGDHGQLPPVGADPGIMRNPDYVLKTIHRQAAESPIIRLAHAIRNGRNISEFKGLGDERLGIYERSSIDRIVHFARSRNVDQIICAFNKTRNAINSAYRHSIGYDDLLCEGDRVICLKNNRRKNIFNGMLFTVRRIIERRPNMIVVDLLDDCGVPRYAMDIEVAPFGGGIYDVAAIKGEVFDHAYAITAHKSQGSEWPHVLVVDQPCTQWDMTRWRYTAFTRAKERLTVVKDY